MVPPKFLISAVLGCSLFTAGCAATSTPSDTNFSEGSSTMPASDGGNGSSGKDMGAGMGSGEPNGGIPMECGMEKLGDMTGQLDSPALRAQIAEKVGHNLIRWIRPGDAITRDMRPNRLNVELDEQGRIAAFRCY